MTMKPYPILIGADDFHKARKALSQLDAPRTLFVVTQKNIKGLHGHTLIKALKGYDIQWILIPDGEKYKTLKTCESLLQKLVKLGAHRKSWLVAFGGGVVGDITGFVASIYMRGINCVQIPTTLLAQVDSSVGGKTGVDFGGGKNLVGSFHQPKAVFIQTQFLKTLPHRQYLSGLAEVIKMASLDSPVFFKLLEKNIEAILLREPAILQKIIALCVRFKTRIVTKDEKEKNLRAILNFGHTLGHAIEGITRYQKFTHGEAVSMGMSFATHLAEGLDLTTDSPQDKIRMLLNHIGLPTAWPRFDLQLYQKFLKTDKKRAGQTIQFILLEKIGKPRRIDLKLEDVLPWL